MKKCLSVLLSALLLSTTVYAKSGDIAGVYYSSDIRALLNGYEIDSINIGGRTLILAEAMSDYGFFVSYDNNVRQLSVNRRRNAPEIIPAAVEKSTLPSGTVLGNYFETDIVTYLDGTPITAYNIGGKTYLLAEEMADFGYEVIWDGQARTLTVTSPDLAGYEYSLFLTRGEKPDTTAESGDGYGAFSISRTSDGILCAGDANLFDGRLSCDGTKYTVSLSFYQNLGLFYSVQLQSLLQSFASSGRGMEPIPPEEKYDLIRQNVTFSINGQTAQAIALSVGGGNGHYDYYFTVTDLPIYKETELTEFYLSVGNVDGLPLYPVTQG